MFKCLGVWVFFLMRRMGLFICYTKERNIFGSIGINGTKCGINRTEAPLECSDSKELGGLRETCFLLGMSTGMKVCG